MAETEQRQIKGAGPLLKADGRLADYGWARQPVLDCNLENAHFYRLRFLQWLRIKRWDYYAIFTPSHFYSFTISDVGYLGSIFAYVIEYEGWKYHEETLTVPLARGVRLPRSSTVGQSVFDNGKVRLLFAAGAGTRRISVHWPNFGGQTLNAEVTLTLDPRHESTVNVIPIGKGRFFYTRKVNCIPALGHVEMGDTVHTFASTSTLACLDWGRGVWNYRSFWLWGSVNAFLPDGRTIGLNLGGGIGDMTQATDASLVLNGRVHKLGKMVFEYDPRNFMQPWKMHSPDGRLGLIFTPAFERVAKTNLVLLSSELHQTFGSYTGTVVSDEGEHIYVKDLPGFVEEHQAKW